MKKLKMVKAMGRRKVGDKFSEPEPWARQLVVLGLAAYDDEPTMERAVAAIKQEWEDGKTKPKRKYRRRDLTAE